MTKKVAHPKKRGGARAGAGRKPRPINSTIFADMVKVAGDGITPLQIMLNLSRAAYQAAVSDPSKVDVELAARAHAWAKDAAPFCHPRLVSHEVGGKGGGAIQIGVTARVVAYKPESGRRIAPPAPANDGHVAPAAAEPAKAAA